VKGRNPIIAPGVHSRCLRQESRSQRVGSRPQRAAVGVVRADGGVGVRRPGRQRRHRRGAPRPRPSLPPVPRCGNPSHRGPLGPAGSRMRIGHEPPAGLSVRLSSSSSLWFPGKFVLQKCPLPQPGRSPQGGGRARELAAELRGAVTVLIGPSGVGKSSLVNALRRLRPGDRPPDRIPGGVCTLSPPGKRLSPAWLPAVSCQAKPSFLPPSLDQALGVEAPMVEGGGVRSWRQPSPPWPLLSSFLRKHRAPAWLLAIECPHGFLSPSGVGGHL